MNIEEIVARLRQTESRSKRKLLDEAADAIEELAKASIVKRIPCEVDPRKEYVELDGIRLVCEEGQIVGWYRPGRRKSRKRYRMKHHTFCGCRILRL